MQVRSQSEELVPDSLEYKDCLKKKNVLCVVSGISVADSLELITHRRNVLS